MPRHQKIIIQLGIYFYIWGKIGLQNNFGWVLGFNNAAAQWSPKYGLAFKFQNAQLKHTATNMTLLLATPFCAFISPWAHPCRPSSWLGSQTWMVKPLYFFLSCLTRQISRSCRYKEISPIFKVHYIPFQLYTYFRNTKKYFFLVDVADECS